MVSPGLKLNPEPCVHTELGSFPTILVVCLMSSASLKQRGTCMNHPAVTAESGWRIRSVSLSSLLAGTSKRRSRISSAICLMVRCCCGVASSWRIGKGKEEGAWLRNGPEGRQGERTRVGIVRPVRWRHRLGPWCQQECDPSARFVHGKAGKRWFDYRVVS